MAPIFNASKLKSFVNHLALLLLLIMSSMIVSSAQSNFKHGRKLFQEDVPAYGGYPGGGGYTP
ncbi:transmembrane protein, putative [Medicago truncatula]|uniref:Transmembrane protein, putative n=1 Tax=Medicago truncatula TaxID=3880 RepID=A0A072V0Y7_MEDTR|nr:transmembrane protein, putative [Medicago truncatula]